MTQTTLKRPLRTNQPTKSVGKSRDTAKIAFGVVLLAVSAAGGTYLVNELSDRKPVLVAARSIAAGTVITQDDLRVADAAIDGVETIPRDHIKNLLGQRAVAQLPAGTLLSKGMFATNPLPMQGFRNVGLALEPTRVPASLTPGRGVDVWEVIKDPSGQGGPSKSLVADGTAHVISVTRDGSMTLVTVSVPEGAAAAVTSASARNAIALALRPVGEQ